jgi:hypothetical protein
MSVLQILSISLGAILLAFVIEAIRRHHLNARYSLLWLAAGVALLTFSLYRSLLDWVAPRLGVAYPPSLMFLVVFVFLLCIVLHYSLVLSAHREAIRMLAQSVALLERALEEQQSPSRHP